MPVHVVDTGEVVDVSAVVEQVTGVVGEEVSVDGGGQDQVVQERT